MDLHLGSTFTRREMMRIALPRPARRAENTPTKEEKAAWLTLFLEGWTVGEISRGYRRGAREVARHLESKGYQASRFRVDESATVEWVALYLDEHWSLAQIAQRYGTSAGTVRYHLARQGAKIRHPAYTQMLRRGKNKDQKRKAA
jgi:DNA-directed RNA polymerase specialized sigma24 family protein